MTDIIDDTTVRTSIEVAVPADRAFHLFTAEIGSWWDAGKHILAAPLAEMVFEPFVGGSIIDRGVDGSECRWARVLEYDPPHRVRFSWDINLRWQIETDLERTSDVEITFTSLDDSHTEVVLTHRNLDRHGPGWEGMRDAVAGGWNLNGFATRSALERLPQISDETMQSRLGRTATYTALVLRATDRLVRPDVDPIIREHGRRNMALVEAGLLNVVLPVTDDGDIAGFGVFAAGLAETDTIMRNDPGVLAGIFSYTLHPVRGFPGAALS
jgi:uncharacterized protein YndB with AHSA1/START domain